jgi:hypothetical protein
LEVRLLEAVDAEAAAARKRASELFELLLRDDLDLDGDPQA